MTMENTAAAQTRASGDRRSPFDRFVEWAHLRVSQAPFFFVCAGIVVGWLISLPLWTDLKEWQTAIHTVSSVLTLLLVALLANAGRREGETAQEKLNVVATALAALMAVNANNSPELQDATKALREAVGLEERH
jgi:low affinity Fe/Cu permease